MVLMEVSRVWVARSHTEILPTVGLDEPDPECDLDYTPNVGKQREINYAMSNSFAAVSFSSSNKRFSTVSS